MSRAARFLLRLPAGLHQALQRVAGEAGLSLNEYCVRRLALSGAGIAAQPGAADVVARAAAVGGNALLGVIVYGSWARGSAAAESDVDVLMILDRGRPLDRGLYRDWDSAPVTWGDRAVDPHFVHLPADGRATGLWGEAAIDGVLLFEAGTRVSSTLAQVRRDIVAGRLVRRMAHGQPYWVAA